VSDFFKDYLTLKLNRTVVIKDIYFTFKDYVKNNDDIEALLKDLLEYSKLYAIILNPMQYQNSFTAVLVRLSQLEFTVIFPVVLAILKRWNEKSY
jgi:hypothetical protein